MNLLSFRTPASRTSKKATCILAMCSILAVCSASAATIVVQNTSPFGTGAYAVANSRYQLFDNTDFAATNDGFGVMGRMTISNAAIASFYLAGNLAAILNAFEPFSTPFSLETTGLAGAFNEARSQDTRASINSLGGNPIFLWIYQGSTLASAREHLIAQLSFNFPTDPESGAPLTGAASLSPSGIANLVVGGFGAFSVDYGAGETLPGYNTAPIPEPATITLFLIGTLMLRRRSAVIAGAGC